MSAAEAAAAAKALLAFVNDDPCDDDYDSEVLVMSAYANAEAADLAAPSDTLWFIHTPLAVAPAKYKRKLPILLLVLLQKFLSTPG